MGSRTYPQRLANALTTRRWEYLAVICGILCALFFLIALAISGNIPPTAPWWDAKRVHDHYWAHVKGTEASSIFVMVSGALYVVYSAVLARQIRKIPETNPIIADLQLASAAASFCGFMIAAIAMGLLTFRDYGPELTQLLNDIFWMATLLSWPIFLVQMWTVAWAIFSDKSPNPVLPRSMGVVNLVTPIVFALGSGVHIHHTGPMAWNGGLVFWPSLVFFGLQINIDFWYMWKNLQATCDLP
ncbi:hypothetical protein N7489_005883 [Penicillium chrysogenum]|jgi:hypothetical protein|uniref:Uncharacterized protein n=1 Tax=Penicillium chrysogenum TaxID=5076 RepID=A0ABQ8WQW6_PENCH|nr:uncharacterized protein N7489_005883 [Penicillium chrysogenum]KAJ5245787.1 hypothetical protein N7489_005883 [Penicillium chrysogenum]KAJ5274140.1 hypothetical protein N7505_002685 [Penicillium chrysogenum]KAJ6136745.1 hypothetical protein N7497_012449 [Penicillium chrysogenum]